MFTLDKKKKQVVRSTHKKRKTIIERIIIETMEIIVMDVENIDPVTTTTAVIAIVQVNESKVLKMAMLLQVYKIEITWLKSNGS